MTDQPGWATPGQEPPEGPSGWSVPPPPPPPYAPYGAAPAAAAVKPGVIPLRPLGIGEILDGAISTVRLHWKVMLGLSAVVVGISQLIGAIFSGLLLSNVSSLTTADPTTLSGSDVTGLLAGTLGGGLVVFALSFLAQTVLTGMLTVVVGRAVLGQEVTLSDTWARFRPLLLPLIGLSLLTTVLSWLGLLLCLLPGVYLWVRWSLAGPALVLEQAGVRGAMRRSGALVRGSWWRVFGVAVLTVIITELISTAISAPVAAVFGFLLPSSSTGALSGTQLVAFTLLTAVTAIIAGTITSPFTASVYALLYVDQRMRREALDLELMRAAGVPLPAASPEAAPQPPQPPMPPLPWDQPPPAWGPPQPPG